MTQEPIYLIVSGEIKPVLCTTRPLIHKWLEKNYPGLEFKTVQTPTDFKIIESGTHYCAASGDSHEKCWEIFKAKKYLGKPLTAMSLVSLAENFARLTNKVHGVYFKVKRNKVRNIY